MRMYLNKNKKRRKKKITIYIISILIILIIIYTYLYKNLNYYYLNYSENEASRIIISTISEAIDDKILKITKEDNLYTFIRNKNGDIEMIDYNSYVMNTFLKDITNNIINALTEKEKSTNKTAFYIPMGSIFQNPILASRGPKIPVKMELIGSVITGIDSKIKEYGINNSLIEIYIHIEVKEKLILPVSEKEIKIVNDIPISYRIIKGQIPSYYGGSGYSYMTPIG